MDPTLVFKKMANFCSRKLGKIAENWAKSPKIGQNCLKLGKIAENLAKSTKIGQNRPKIGQNPRK
jgi:hypothetical protein